MLAFTLSQVHYLKDEKLAIVDAGQVFDTIDIEQYKRLLAGDHVQKPTDDQVKLYQMANQPKAGKAAKPVAVPKADPPAADADTDLGSGTKDPDETNGEPSDDLLK